MGWWGSGCVTAARAAISQGLEFETVGVESVSDGFLFFY